MEHNGATPRRPFDQVAMESYRAATVTVAILAQGTSWAVADTQAFLASGSIPTRVESRCSTSNHWNKAFAKKLVTLLDLCVSSLRRGHANLLCIVPILTDDPRRESS